jgi:hypothetical protein
MGTTTHDSILILEFRHTIGFIWKEEGVPGEN